MTRIIIRAVPSRADCIAYLSERLPDAEFIVDHERRGARETFSDALALAGDGPAVLMEEDIILTVSFREKLEAAIRARPGDVIQFFSMRGKDLTQGSRWDRTFAMSQCTYFPPGDCRDLLAYAPRWPARAEHRAGCDILVNDWLRSVRRPYWLHVPSLVEHRPLISEIRPGRSTHRQSKTFKEPWL